MAYVGSMGGVPFITSTMFVRTFSDFSREGSARWAQHDLLGKKPIQEFIGPDVEKIRLKIHFSAQYGMNPNNEYKKLCKIRDNGKVIPVIIGGRPINDNLWVIESLSEAIEYTDGFGATIASNVEVTLKEYPLGRSELP